MITPSMRSALIALFATPALALVPATASGQTVDVNPNISHQVVRGYGGHSGVGWIADLTPGEIETAYGTGPGQVGLSIMRMRIDPNRNAWQRQLAVARLAKAKGATLFATPWSPPAPAAPPWPARSTGYRSIPATGPVAAT